MIYFTYSAKMADCSVCSGTQNSLLAHGMLQACLQLVFRTIPPLDKLLYALLLGGALQILVISTIRGFSANIRQLGILQ